MNILRLRHIFYPDIPKDFFFELSIFQVNQGHKVDVITWNKNNRKSEEQIIHNFNVHRLKAITIPLLNNIIDFPFFLKLEKKIKDINPDLIHIESHLFISSYQTVKIAKKMKIPCILTVHGVRAERNFFLNLLQTIYLYTFGSFTLNKADIIICLTKSDAKEICKYGSFNNKIEIIPNAVDTNLFIPREKKENLIVTSGRFVNEKGLIYLIKAIKIILNYKSIKLYIIGFGPLEYKLKKFVEKNKLNNNIIFLGKLPRNKIANILGKSILFIIPSLKEGMPISLLEAMSAENIILGSNISGINDVIIDGYNGFLVQPKNENEIASKIIKILFQIENKKEIARNARKTIIDNYNYKILLKKIDYIYNKIVVVK